jgi:hypothetical protein
MHLLHDGRVILTSRVARSTGNLDRVHGWTGDRQERPNFTSSGAKSRRADHRKTALQRIENTFAQRFGFSAKRKDKGKHHGPHKERVEAFLLFFFFFG